MARNISNTIAANLAAKNYTLGSLKKMSDQQLGKLQLSAENIKAIKDGTRPAIPVGTVRELLDESLSTCCVCRVPGKPFVLHHIEKWASSQSHAKGNLVLLCLEHHNQVHTTHDLCANLKAHDVKVLKAKWVEYARKIKGNYDKALANTAHRSPRWYWIHWEHLKSHAAHIPPPSAFINSAALDSLKKNRFIDNDGCFTPEGGWLETLEHSKRYLFDSGNAQSFTVYVSDVMSQWIKTANIIDVNDMLAYPIALRAYLNVGSLIYVRGKFDVETNLGNEDYKNDVIHARLDRTEIRIKFSFNAWTSMNSTARGTHLRTSAERSVIGQVASIDLNDGRLLIILTPLGISPDFVLHDRAHGDSVSRQNNSGVKKRRRMAKDI